MPSVSFDPVVSEGVNNVRPAMCPNQAGPGQRLFYIGNVQD